ncbi:MAG: RNA-guided endonuclease IscB [Deltaproteobacteria bacterium]
MFVLDHDGKPLDPCHPARARRLLASGRAVVVRHSPFTIRLRDREASSSTVHRLTVKIDPGSKGTGICLVGVDEQGCTHAIFSLELVHRGAEIHKKLVQRAAYRRRRRSKNLRYRAPRFNNRRRQPGWLPPSVQHRVDSTVSATRLIRRLAPVDAAALELVRFDLQGLEDPGIAGVEYQHGTLFGYEVREYLLEKFSHACAYCGAVDTALNIDHVRPRARGGSDRVSNLVIACIACNEAKGARPVEEFLANDQVRLKTVLAQLKAPLRDAAAVNASRFAILESLRALGLEVACSSGGQTKWSRTNLGLPKTHTIDALCVGSLGTVASVVTTVAVAKAMGRGSYQRTVPDRFGFPRLKRPRQKRFFGFATGDLVCAVVPKGNHAGTHVGRVAVRSSGSFNITTSSGVVQGISYRYCTLLQRGDGRGWSAKQEGELDAA